MRLFLSGLYSNLFKQNRKLLSGISLVEILVHVFYVNMSASRPGKQKYILHFHFYLYLLMVHV